MNSEKHVFPENGERIAKVLARRGICSRREAERLIAEGVVEVDGVVLSTPAFKVTNQNQIKVKGRVVPNEEKTRLWRLHKQAGLVTTHNDPQDRPTVFDRLPDGLPRVISVGRLDLNSEGLLLLTNDGALSRRLELPSNGWHRRYRVRVFGRLSDDDMKRLVHGIDVDGQQLRAIEANLDKAQGGNCWVTIVLDGGKNREIRRMVEALGGRVNRLIRTDYGPFQLGDLGPGMVEEAKPSELAEILGAKPRNKKTAKKRPKRNAPDRRKIQRPSH